MDVLMWGGGIKRAGGGSFDKIEIFFKILNPLMLGILGRVFRLVANVN